MGISKPGDRERATRALSDTSTIARRPSKTNAQLVASDAEARGPSASPTTTVLTPTCRGTTDSSARPSPPVSARPRSLLPSLKSNTSPPSGGCVRRPSSRSSATRATLWPGAAIVSYATSRPCVLSSDDAMPAPDEREGIKGGDDPQRHEDHVGEFPETRPIEIEEHHARHGKPDASPQAEKEMPEPGEHQAQGCRKDRTPHGARSYRRTRVRPVCFRRGTARRAPTSIFCALASRSRASASTSAA